MYSGKNRWLNATVFLVLRTGLSFCSGGSASAFGAEGSVFVRFCKRFQRKIGHFAAEKSFKKYSAMCYLVSCPSRFRCLVQASSFNVTIWETIEFSQLQAKTPQIHHISVLKNTPQVRREIEVRREICYLLPLLFFFWQAAGIFGCARPYMYRYNDLRSRWKFQI